MKIDFGPNPYFYPLPVILIGTYDLDKVPNVMNAAWGGVYDTTQIHICLSSDHKSSENIRLNREFTIAFADVKHVKEADYFGIESGNNVNKIEKTGIKIEESKKVNAPLLSDFPISMECKVIDLQDDGETMHIIGEVLSVLVDENIVENKKINIQKAHIITYVPSANKYAEIGDNVADAFKVGLEFKK